jgi:hypothetical protein
VIEFYIGDNEMFTSKIFPVIVSLLCIVFLLPCTAMCEEWIRYRTDEYFDSFYDKSTLVRVSPTIVKVLKKEVLKTEEAKSYMIQQRTARGLPVKGYENFKYVLTLGMIDCHERKTTMLSMAEYSESGKVLMKMNFPSDIRKWVPIPEGSIVDDLRQRVCR